MVCFMELPFIFIKYLKYLGRDFPSGPVVKNLPSNAGDPGLIPGGGTKISHVAAKPTRSERDRRGIERERELF